MQLRITPEEIKTTEQHMEQPSEKEFEYIKSSLQKDLTLVLVQYESQLASIPKRLQSRKNSMIAAILTFTFMVLVDLYFEFLLNLPGGSILAGTIEMWVAVIAVFIALWKSFFWMMDSIIEYNTQNETLRFLKFKHKYKVFTLRDEERFCKQKIDECREMMVDLKNTTSSDNLDAYQNHRYIDKRGYSMEFSFFQEHQIGCFIGIVICMLVTIIP